VTTPERGPDVRLTPEKRPKRRTEAARDRDRIIYSSAFNRMSQVTQVTTSSPTQSLHNRLLHALKVGQLARRAAEAIQQEHPQLLTEDQPLEPEAAEAAGFAHDLGHPPFGHAGEQALCGLTEDIGGFDANAQSLRIVTRLARRHRTYDGLNLTRQTLNGILKYPWLRGPGGPGGADEGKWGVYDSELEILNFARDRDTASPEAQTRDEPLLLAQVVEWADDVTYAVHDIEDFYKADLIPIDRFNRQRDQFWNTLFDERGQMRAKFTEFSEAVLGEALDTICNTFVLGPNAKYDRMTMMRGLVRQMCSTLIETYFEAAVMAVESSATGPCLNIAPNKRAEVLLLKELLWYFVIDQAPLAAIQRGQGEAIRTIYEAWTEAARKRVDWRLLPPAAREQIRNGPGDSTGIDAEHLRCRIITDAVALLPEPEAWDVHLTLTGQSPGSRVL
jgi:dGTPase